MEQRIPKRMPKQPKIKADKVRKLLQQKTNPSIPGVNMCGASSFPFQENIFNQLSVSKKCPSKRYTLQNCDVNRASDHLCYVGGRAVSREFPTGNSREIPEKSRSRTFPRIIFGSREFSGIFYVLWRDKFLNFTIF